MDEVVKIYTDAMAKMPDFDKFGGNSSAVVESINELKTTLEDMSKAGGEAIGDLAASMTESSSIIETKMNAVASAIERSQQRIVDAIEKTKKATPRGGRNDKATTADVELAERMDQDWTRKRIGEIDQARGMMEREFNSRAKQYGTPEKDPYDQAKEMDQGWMMRRAAMVDQARAMMERDFKTRGKNEIPGPTEQDYIEALRMDQEWTMRRIELINRARAEMERELNSRNKDGKGKNEVPGPTEEDYVQAIRMDQEWTMRRIELINRARAEMERDLAKGNKRPPSEEPSSNKSEIDRFLGGLTSDFAKSAGGILKSVLIFDTVNAILSTTANLLKAPFEAIANGFNYLQDVQNRAAEVKAALLQSVSYSADYGENLKIAGEQADSLVRKIDNLAVKLHVSSQSVQTGFTTFLESGGRNLTHSVDESLQLSGLIVGAMQTQTPNIEARRLVGEMQKLASGNVAQTDRLATALGLSKEQLAEMVRHAQKYHDLYDEILAKSPGIADKIADANGRFAPLLANLKLLGDRFDGLIAKPLFDRVTKLLQQITDWIDKHEGAITKLGTALGILVDQAAKLSENFLKANWGELVATFKVLAYTALTVGAMMTSMVQQALDLVNLAKEAKNLVAGGAGHVKDWAGAALSGTGIGPMLSLGGSMAGSVLGLGNSASKDNSSSQGSGDGTAGLFTALSGVFSAISHITDTGKADEGTPPPDKPKDNLHLKDAKAKTAELAAAQKELQDEVAKTENEYGKMRDEVKSALTSGTINHKDAANQLRGLHQQEMSEVNQLINKYKEKAEVLGKGKNDPKVKGAVAAMDKIGVHLDTNLDNKDSAADSAANAEDLAIAKQHTENLAKVQIEYLKGKLARIKESAKDGREAQLEAFDVETQIQTQEYLVNRQKDEDDLERTVSGSKEREAAQGKLDVLDAQYTQNVLTRADQRIRIIEKETEAALKHQEAMAKIEAEGKGLSVGIRGPLDPRSEFEDNQRLLKLQMDLTNAEILHTRALLAQAEAKEKDSSETRKLQQQLGQLNNQQAKQTVDYIKAAGTRYAGNPAAQQVAMHNAANAQIDQLKKSIEDLTSALNNARQAGDNKAIGNLQGQIDTANGALGTAQQVSDATKPNTGSQMLQTAGNALFGDDTISKIKDAGVAFGKASDGVDKLTQGSLLAADGLSGLTNLGSAILGSMKQYEQGKAQGGVIGGVGSLLSSGPISNMLSAIPVVGSIVKPLGAAFSFIGDMFVEKARKIAEQIDKSITNINNLYSTGQATLQQTIQALEQQRQDAVQQLSGVKGGEDQLNKLLPSLDQQIASLEQQAANLQKSFQDSVTQLMAGGTELQQWVQTWQGINKQVEDYIAGGGDLKTANEFLVGQLANQQKTLMDGLVSGQQQAIQDALNLNQLIQQRIDLLRQEQQTEFGIISQNAIEKRESTGVQVASQLANQRYGFNEQLQQLDYQLQTAQQKVSLESKVFNIAQSTADLQAQSNALTLYSLNEQLQVYQQMQQILAGIANLKFSSSAFTPFIPGTSISGDSAVSGIPAMNPIVVNVTVGSGASLDGKQFGTYVGNAIAAKISANRTGY